jgi:hypothetical protein
MCQKNHLINLDKLIWTYPLCLGDILIGKIRDYSKLVKNGPFN